MDVITAQEGEKNQGEMYNLFWICNYICVSLIVLSLSLRVLQWTICVHFIIINELGQNFYKLKPVG